MTLIILTMQGQSKYVVITANEGTECFRYLSANYLLPVQIFEEFGDPTYFVGQYEIGENGNKHWQLYVEYPRVHRLSTYKRRYFEGCHLEKRERTALQAANYCKKAPEEPLLEPKSFEIGMMTGGYDPYWYHRAHP